MPDTSTSSNVDAVANQEAGGSGEFHAKVGRDEPMTTHGHQPGVQVGNDAVPEFQAETLPAGTAPADRTFKPNNISEVPPTTNKVDPDAPQPAANDFPGATSGDVHTGLGHPGQGQTSQELHDKTAANSLEGRKSGA